MLEPDMDHEEVARYLRNIKEAEIGKLDGMTDQQLSESCRLNERLGLMLEKMRRLAEANRHVKVSRPQNLDFSGKKSNPDFLQKIEEAINNEERCVMHTAPVHSRPTGFAIR
ncbi:MAG: hypothetical protein PHS57_06670 [Alphaproteobacteria bacterium]|nr:hypothetical protein [Alphaproteobacteria bacterium]